MDQSAIADRRRLRRKLGFWRIAAAVLVIGLGIAAFRLAGGDMAAGSGSPHIARIEISGLIQDDEELLGRLKKIGDSDRVKALVVSISSPGGTTYGGERIFKAIRAVAEKKPVVSDVRTLAASAGYMIATAGDTIIAGETSITGSIGVIFQYPQTKQLLDKIGVSLEEIKSAPLKAEPSPFHDASEEAKAMIRAMVMDSYDWFVDLVADRRKLSRDEVLRLADGSIFTGRQALKARLIDTLGGEESIRTYLTGRGIDKDLKIVKWEAPRTGSAFGFASAISTVLNLFGYGDINLGTVATDKLFLDGLISVWQVGRH